MSYSTDCELSKRNNKGGLTLEQALDRTYIVKASGDYSQHIILPKILFGKRVKIVLVEDEVKA